MTNTSHTQKDFIFLSTFTQKLRNKPIQAKHKQEQNLLTMGYARVKSLATPTYNFYNTLSERGFLLA